MANAARKHLDATSDAVPGAREQQAKKLRDAGCGPESYPYFDTAPDQAEAAFQRAVDAAGPVQAAVGRFHEARSRLQPPLGQHDKAANVAAEVDRFVAAVAEKILAGQVA